MKSFFYLMSHQLSSFLWTSCIAWHACAGFVLRKTRIELQSYFKFYVIVSWLFPIGPAAFLYVDNAFGVTDGSWCWIVLGKSVYRFYLFWGPVLVIWLFDCICYGLVKRHLREVISFMEQSTSRRILAYVLAFILVISVPLTNRILQQFFEPQFPLVVLHAAFDPLLGFCNAVVYGWSKHVRQSCVRCLCKCCQKSSNIQSSDTTYDYSASLSEAEPVTIM